MIVYKAEKDAGLESLLSCAMGSVKYDVDITKSNLDLLDKIVASQNKVVAEHTDFDLFSLASLMVSVGWNKNFDVFLRSEVWKARATPEDKPLNIQHNELDIIGHIIANYVIDNEGNVIPSDTKFEDLPDIFHIIANSVVYTKWSDEARLKIVADIVEQIKKDLEEEDKSKAFWKVSMECLFSGFDYAVVGEDGKERIIERNEASAFLTSALKCYGGTGQYGKYKIGRAMRNICFSALGLVNKPANPDSVIFDGVLSFREESTSSINEIMETVMANDNLDTTKELVNELKSKVEASEANIKSLTEKLSNSEKSSAELSTKVEKIEAENKVLNDKVVALETEKADLVKKLDESETKVSAAEKTLAEIKANEVKAKRISVFVEKGMSKEDAEKQVEKLANLDDATFETVASLVSVAKVETPVVTTPADAGAAAASVIDTAKPNEKPAVVVPDANEGIEKVRAGLSEVVGSFLVNKNKKK